MIVIPAQYKLEDTAENIAYLKGLLLQSQEILHPENIYYGRLLTAYTNCTGGKDSTVAGADVHKLVCNNFRRCFPAADRHMGYQLINIVQSLIQEGRREEAVPYAYEAMTIFEVCFGLEHPFYLQTLALWTYLENGSDKSNEQLLSLTSFENNKLVNIGGLLHPEDQQ